jgi:AcrR family transcriptional regulator
MSDTPRRRPIRPRKQPVQDRARDTVEILLRAAAQVFAARGYAATTTNKVAERAGVSIGSLYQYFPNKDALLVALINAHVHEGETILIAAATAAVSAHDALPAATRRLVRAMVELHARDRALHQVLFEEAPLPRTVRRQLQDLETRATALLEQYLIAVASPPLPDPGLAAAIIVHTVEALTHKLVVHERGSLDADRWIDEISTLVLRYLSAPV